MLVLNAKATFSISHLFGGGSTMSYKCTPCIAGQKDRLQSWNSDFDDERTLPYTLRGKLYSIKLEQFLFRPTAYWTARHHDLPQKEIPLAQTGLRTTPLATVPECGISTLIASQWRRNATIFLLYKDQFGAEYVTDVCRKPFSEPRVDMNTVHFRRRFSTTHQWYGTLSVARGEAQTPKQIEMTSCEVFGR